MSRWVSDIATDDEDMREFAHILGYAILNCCNIELMSYRTIALLTGAHQFDNDSGKGLYSKRKDKIF